MKTAKTIKNNQNLMLTVRVSEQVFCGLLEECRKLIKN